MNRVYLVVLLVGLLGVFQAGAQTATSQTSGPWNDAGTWDCGCIPDASNGEIRIAAGDVVTIPVSVTVNADEIVVESTAELVIAGTLEVQNGTTDLDIVAGGLVTVQDGGVLQTEDDVVVTSTATTLVFEDGSEFRFNQNGDAIPTADWQTGSTCRITGITTSPPSPTSLGQTFYNFIWDCSGQTVQVGLNGSLTTVNGNLEVLNTNNQVIVLGLSLSVSPASTINIGGDLVVAAPMTLNTGNSKALTINIGGTLIKSSASTLFLAGGTSSSTIINTVNFELTNGFVVLGINTGTSNLNISGDFTFTGGDISETTSASTAITFNGSGIQNYIGGGSFSPGTTQYTVNSGSILNLSTYAIGNSTSSFTCNNGGTVQVGSTNLQGNIVCSTRTFASGSTIVYNGTGNQEVGSAHPTTTGVHTVVDKPSGSLSLNGSRTIGGNLVLQNGNLTIGSNTLTLVGTISSPNGSLVAATNSNITINGSGAFGTLPISGSTTINNFTVSRSSSGTVTLGSNLAVNGTLNQTAGTIVLNGNTLTVSGTYSGAPVLTADASSGFVLTGAIIGTISVTINGTIGVFTLDPPFGTLNVAGSPTINALNHYDGTLGGAFTIGDNGVITRSGGGTLGATISAVGTYDVVYDGGALPAGTELTVGGSQLNDLDVINGSIVFLTSSFSVNGTFSLQSGSINAQNVQVTVRGDFIINSPGTFDPATSTVVFDGTTTISGTQELSLNNVTLNTGASLTLPASNINIAGDVTFQSGATLTSTGSTVTLNGGSDQTISGGGYTLNNITVDKAGGEVFLVDDELVITGLLDVSSSTVFNSDGFLRLRSTSDGTSGNASIGPLLSGAAVSGDVIVERFMSSEGNIFRYISSPVQNTSVADLQSIPFYITGGFTGSSTCGLCTTNPSMFYYDASLTTPAYQPFPAPASDNTEEMEVGRGYSAFVYQGSQGGPVTLRFEGAINQGNVNLPVEWNGSTNTWNLLGNPYPSTISWGAGDDTGGWTGQTTVGASIAVRDNGSGGIFRYWDGGIGEDDLTNGNIAAGQAFWVLALDGSSALTVTESAKTSETGAFLRLSEDELHYITISMSNGQYTDKAYVRLREGAVAGEDRFDAPKLNNQVFDIATYTFSDSPKVVAINALDELDCTKKIAIRISDMTNGTYTMSLNSFGSFANLNWILHDRYLGTSIQLSGNNHTFSVTSDAASKASDRFELEIADQIIDTSLAIDGLDIVCAGDGELVVLNSQPQINYVVDVNGELYGTHHSGTGSNLSISLDNEWLSTGANVVKVRGFNGCSSTYLNASHTIIKQPLKEAIAENGSTCQSGSVTLQASGAETGDVYNWYESEDASTPVAQGSTFETPVLAKSSTYYVSITNTLGCEGNRVPALATIVQYQDVVIQEQEGELISNYETGNQWYRDGVLIEGATEQTYKPTRPGIYSVEIDVEGCVATGEYDFIITGIEESVTRIMAYPNPFNDRIVIEIPKSTGRVSGASLINTLGQQVGEFSIREYDTMYKGELNAAEYRQGAYIVKIQLDSGIINARLIKR